jgi:hemolysin activation/secretion protein
VSRVVGIVLLLVAPLAAAQVPTGTRPGEERPTVPEFEREEEPALRLPPLERLAIAPPAEVTGIVVQRVEFEGNRALGDPELQAVAAPYLQRALSADDLVQLRDEITGSYVSRGYVTSGAVIPDQRVTDGVLRVRIVEGVLSEVTVQGTRRLRANWVRVRLEGATRGIVNVRKLERALRLLQQEDSIAEIHARLRPGEEPGQSELQVEILEGRMRELRLRVSNEESPSIGEEAAELAFTQLNLLGRNDALELALGSSEGLGEWKIRYTLPLLASGLELEMRAERSKSDVVEEPFEVLDIESESITYSATLRAPIWRDPAHQLWFGLTGEIRRSESFVLGERFSFSPGPEDGVSKLSVLRLVQEWTSRGRNQVMAARSTFSFGLELFGATDFPSSRAGSGVPDGTFAAWLGQVQWLRRLPERYRGAQIVTRADVQLTRDPLLSLERFSLGGHGSVRGYRENTLVRDNAVVASLELRYPLIRSALGRDVLQVAPFFDIGRAWNETDNRGPRTLASLGIGLRYEPADRLSLSLYWGGRLRDVPRADDGLQRYGLHFRATTRLF